MKHPALILVFAATCFLGRVAPSSAQIVEIAPFGGYRFGGDFFELVTNQPIDLDGAPSIGVAINVPLRDGLFVEGIFSHQDAEFTVPASAFGPGTRWRIVVEHWLAGGLQEFGSGKARPFLSGLFGLTRYAGQDDNEIRFTVGAAGGVKLFPTRRIGARLDGRVFATFVDVEGRTIACSPGVCLAAFSADVVWQTEFTAGLVVVF